MTSPRWATLSPAQRALWKNLLADLDVGGHFPTGAEPVVDALLDHRKGPLPRAVERRVDRLMRIATELLGISS